MNKVGLVSIFFLILSTRFCFSLPSSFHTVNTENGLSSNRINTIFKDKRGFIWLGTQVGINRFDGNIVKYYDLAGNDEVFCINETDSVFLWIGTENGLKRYNRKTNEVEIIDLGINRFITKDIYAIGKDHLLVATNKGLFHITSSHIEHIVFENGMSSANSLTGICRQNLSSFWLSSQAGLCHYDLSTKNTEVFKGDFEFFGSNNLIAVTCVDSVLYAGSYNRGIIRFNMNTSKFDILPEFRDNYILNVKHYDGKLYICTNGHGLKIYSLKTGKTETIQHEIRDPYSINSNAVYSFLLDNNTFWIGTYKGGLNYNLNINDNFQVYQTDKFNSHDYNIRSFWIDENNNQLIGTRSGLIYLSKNSAAMRKYTQNDASILTSDIILYIAPYQQNEYFVGTYGGGLYIFNTKTLSLSRFRNEDIFISGCIFRFYKDKNNTWWFATDRGLLEYTDSGILNQYTSTNSQLTHNNILYLREDSKNRIWLGTSDGLCVFDKTSKYMKTDVLDNYPGLNVIIYAMEDSQGDIWVASHQAFAKVNSALTKVTPISFNQENIGVMSIVEDDEKNIWLASNQGIIKYNIITSKYQTYNMGDGIIGYDFANVVQKTNSNDLWWANERGLIHCYLPNLKKKRGEQKPAITSVFFIKKTGPQVSLYNPEFESGLSFSSDENNIGFTFSLLNYSMSQADIYEYMLEGYDKTWRTQIGKNEISYFGLPPGKYMFRLRNANDNMLETSISITIKSDVKKLIAGIVVIIIFLLFIAAFLYNNKIRNRDKQRGKSVQEKYSNSKIHDTDARRIKRMLDNYMESEKAYLNSELKQSDVAKKINVSSGDLSQVLNQYAGMNFSDYVNQYRIEELAKRMDDKAVAKYTLTALAEQCGFSSRSSFFRAIKKHTGQTPAEFLKKIENKPKGKKGEEG